jgi:heme oxygenase
MISEILKNQTKELHDRVEQKFNSAKIFEENYTPDDYSKLLTYNYLFLRSCEEPVFESLSENFGELLALDKRRKIHLFDLEKEHLNTEKHSAGEICVNSEAEALGIMYVMEGSTLGGNMIAKKLEASDSFMGSKFPYFRCYGDRTGSMWKNFKSVLDEVISEDDHGDVLKGAEKAYHFLLRLPD